MSLAGKLLFPLLCLLVLASGQAAPIAGIQAQGRVTLSGPHGVEAGAIVVSAWGADYCRIVIQVDPPTLRQEYTAVANGKHVSVTGPAELAAAVPLPIGPASGCALLSTGHGAGGALARDTEGRPLTLAWTERGQQLALRYGDYAAGDGPQLAQTVTETAGGKALLTVRFNSVSAPLFSEADFPFPPRPAGALRRGGQQ